MTDKPQIDLLTHSPVDMTNAGLAHIEQLKKFAHRVLPSCVPDLQGYFAPLTAGEVCVILAQTHNYKSGHMKAWERFATGYLRQHERQGEVVIHVDLESTLEGIALQELAIESGYTVADLSSNQSLDWKRLMKAVKVINGVNIFTISHTLGDKKAPPLTMTNIYRCINHIENTMHEHQNPIAAIFVDYLQALPFDDEVAKKSQDYGRQKRLQVSADFDNCRILARHFNCPVVVGVQAKQELSCKPPLLIPAMYDGQETSFIAQRADAIISQWMPKTTSNVGDWVNAPTIDFQVEEDDIFVKVLKRRGGHPSGMAIKNKIDYRSGNIIPDRIIRQVAL